MLNAVQVRLTEEVLVEKEVHEAMLQLRERIDAIGRTPRAGTSERRPAARRETGPPVLPDLPVGTPPPGMVPRSRGVPAAPVPVSASSVLPVDASGVAGDVLAVGDPSRDPARPVAPFIPETSPGVSENDPFPQLGLKGRPLG